MKHLEQVKTKLKGLEDKLPVSYPDIILIDESKGETVEAAKLKHGIPEAAKDIIYIVDDIK